MRCSAALYVVCCCAVSFNSFHTEKVAAVLAGIYRQYSTIFGTAHSTIERSMERSTPHTSHAESAIHHAKNKAWSTALNLPYALPTRWVGALLRFAVHTIDMVSRSNAHHQMSAYTSFMGRTPSYAKFVQFVFGTVGFLQRAFRPSNYSGKSRSDYFVWLVAIKSTPYATVLDYLIFIHHHVTHHTIRSKNRIN